MAAARARQQAMEELSDEGRAIFATVTKEAEDRHARHQQDLRTMISNSVNEAIEKAMERQIEPMIRGYSSRDRKSTRLNSSHPV